MAQQRESYTLHEVTTSRDDKDFHEFPKKIYKGNRNWVCPITEDIKKIFDPEKNQLFKDGEAIRWVVRNEKGKVVGRIAAFYNNEKAAIEEQLTGGCGFFEAIDSQEVANMLFEASRLWLLSRGMEAMDGPINFGQRDTWWGLLVEGFEFQPLYENPYNPPYYQPLFENYGFKNYFNQNTYIWRCCDDDVNQWVRDRAARLNETPGYTFRTIDMNDLEGEAEKFRIIYNKAWALFNGVQPLDKAEALKIMMTIKPIIDSDIIFFAYFNDEPIGFYIMVPDLNRIIGKFNGKLGLWQKIRLMWDLKVTRSCDRIFGIIFGVIPELRGRGVESGMMQAVLDQYIRTPKNHYKTLELAWIGDFNPVMCRMVENYVGATKHKMHTTYRYLFDREKEFKRCPRMGVKKQE
ncbi:MAG: hypothetical protein R3Y16_03355 [Rikenellaceae bacterium]